MIAIRSVSQSCLIVVALVTPSTAWSEGATETPFAVENRIAMDRMMAAMHAPLTGDVDQDFSAMMMAHHQAAIDMAKAELRHGSNEELRRIAQGIVVQQQQEIEAMRRAVGQRGVEHQGPLE